MNREIMGGHWQQAMGKLQEYWGNLIGDELTVIAGRRARQSGRLLLRYGLARQDAERQLRRCQRLSVAAARAGLVRVPVRNGRAIHRPNF